MVLGKLGRQAPAAVAISADRALIELLPEVQRLEGELEHLRALEHDIDWASLPGSPIEACEADAEETHLAEPEAPNSLAARHIRGIPVLGAGI